MILKSEFAESVLNIFFSGILGNTENLVVVFHLDNYITKAKQKCMI
jgi:hypothetical protein